MRVIVTFLSRVAEFLTSWDPSQAVSPFYERQDDLEKGVRPVLIRQESGTPAAPTGREEVKSPSGEAWGDRGTLMKQAPNFNIFKHMLT